MFVAWRDLRHAKGRFALMTSVIILITLLVTFLAALTAGLGRASTSAITDLPADQLAFAAADDGSDPTFTGSQVTADQWTGLADVAGVAWTAPLGVAQTRATANDRTTSITALGVDSARLTPSGLGVERGQILLTPDAAESLNVTGGSGSVTMGSLQLDVVGTAPDQLDYAHTPVAWISLEDWQSVGAHPQGDDEVATVVALGLDPAGESGPVASAAAGLDAVAMSLPDARSAISSFASEHLSLTAMQGFLFVVSALVVGVFFTVWTINRGGDIAVIKALGGSTGYLMRDAIGQAVAVLLLGTGIGALTATGLGLLAGQVMPVVVDLTTMVGPALLLTALGLIGASVAVARIGRIDPHSALAAR